MKFHTSAASGRKKGQSDLDRNLRIPTQEHGNEKASNFKFQISSFQLKFHTRQDGVPNDSFLFFAVWKGGMM